VENPIAFYKPEDSRLIIGEDTVAMRIRPKTRPDEGGKDELLLVAQNRETERSFLIPRLEVLRP
jgi:hypothetical protein